VSVASAVRWVKRFNTTGEISGSGRIEAHRDYLLGLIRRRPEITLLEASRTGSRLPAVQRDRPSLFSPLDVHDVQVGRG
jgi:hypothetical protein